MIQETQRHEITKKRVVYKMPGMDAVTIRRDGEDRLTDAGALTMDLYYPPDSKNKPGIPAVIFVAGFFFILTLSPRVSVPLWLFLRIMALLKNSNKNKEDRFQNERRLSSPYDSP
jgi:hypothetical protein